MKEIAFTITIFALLCSQNLAQESQKNESGENAAEPKTRQEQTAVVQADNLEQSKEPGVRKPDVRYVPTPQNVVDLMLELAYVKETDLLYDLGCGDGRIVVTAAKKYGCRAVGVDIDPERVREARANVKAANLENLVTIEQKDVFEIDLSKVDVVMMYLLPELNVRLIPQLEKLKPGSRVVSHDFDMRGVEPDVVLTSSLRLLGGSKIYMWEIPLKKVAIDETELPIIDLDAAQKKASAWQSALLVIFISALCLASFFWLLRKRVGVIKFHVTIDRTQKNR